MQKLLAWIRSHQRTLLTWLCALIVYQYAITQANQYKLFSWPATRWMNIYNYSDFQTWEQVGDYFLELRTGVPPVASLLEIIAYQQNGNWDSITVGLYRQLLALLFALPFFFMRGRWWELLIGLGIAWVMVDSTLIVHKGNPQIYDVMLPIFVMLYFLCTRASLRPLRGTLVWAVLAGFWLSMAELSRPFMIAIVGLLLIWQACLYLRRGQKAGRKKLIAFLVPLLLFSGGWHTKLLFRHGQLIWSNHGGSNLVNAWEPVVDHRALNQTLLEEAPPREDNPWTQTDLNTEAHAQNSKLRSQAVVAGIKSHPWEAWQHFQRKANIFLEPRVDMYAYQPDNPILRYYQWIVNAAYAILGFLVIKLLSLFWRKREYLLREESALVLLTVFLTVMPIIGENGEEARFMVSVTPLLLLCAYYGLTWLIAQFKEPSLDPEV